MNDPRLPITDLKLLRVDTPDGQRDGSLCDVLAWLSAGELLEFTALRPHQSHAWHAFLVQLAVLALRAAAESKPWREPNAWRSGLLRLTGDQAAWTLVVDDVSLPAFLQPPVPEGSLDSFSVDASTPDELDSLVITSTNHDVKARRMSHPRLEHWLLALVDLQTMQGYSGRSRFGIARMNGGFGTRPAVALAASADPATRFCRDVAVWMERHAKIGAAYGFAPRGGLGLLWLDPWDGGAALSIDQCDPAMIEICRRPRLVVKDAVVMALGKPTSSARIESKAFRGNLGDPWIPVLQDAEPSALTPSHRGFHYALMSELLFGATWQRPAALDARAEDGNAPEVIAQALARGQGKTGGWHERVVPIPPSSNLLFRSADGRSRLGERATAQVQSAAQAQRAVLRLAVLALQQGAPAKLNLRDDRANVWTQRFDREVDRRFFPHLWETVDITPEEAGAKWRQELVDLGWSVLDQAIQSTPIPAARRYHVLSEATGLYIGLARKELQSTPSLLHRAMQEEELDGATDSSHVGIVGSDAR